MQLLVVAQLLAFGKREIDEHRVQLRDHREQAGIARGGHQAALAHRLLAGYTGDRRRHQGVAEVELRLAHLGTRRIDRGQRVLVGRAGIVEILAADRVLAEQRLDAIAVGACALEVGLLLAHLAARLVELGLEGFGVDLE
jgi:hypothetical protein